MAVIKLQIYVANLDNVMGLFDEMQVWRSTTGDGGPFTEITAAAAAAATLTGSEDAPFTLNGLTLNLEIDGGSEQTVTFSTADPVGIDFVLSAVNDAVTGATATEDNGALVITSDNTGTDSIVEITGGTALTELGFTTGDIDYGEAARITLQAGVENYEFDDESGDADYYYRTRYYNSVTGAVSSYGVAVQGSIGTIISSSNLIKAVIDLAGLDGSPLDEQRVTFFNVYAPPISVTDIGVLGRSLEITTDQAGHAETMLIKGALLDVAIPGTGIVRQITVPSSGTEFNLMDELIAADDLFQIQTPDIPLTIRRS